MAAASPTPMGQGSVVTTLGRRTSARQALRAPSTRTNASGTASKRTSPASAADAHQQQQQYSTLNDSSDDEMPIPMKLSALTEALLSDGASASEAAAAAAAAANSSAPVMATRRRSALNRSTSSVSGVHASADANNSQFQSSERPGVRQTRRHVRAGSMQASAPSSASRPTSPPNVLSRDTSPAPRRRVVRLSSTTPATGMGPVQPPVRRLSRRVASPEERNATGNNGRLSITPTEERGSSIDAVMASAPAHPTAEPAEPDTALAEPSVNTPSSSMRRVQITVGSSAGRDSARRSARLSGSSSGLRPLSAAPAAPTAPAPTSSGHHSDGEHHDEPPSTVGRPIQQHQAGSVLRSYGNGSASVVRSGSREVDQQALQGSMRIQRVGKVLGGGFLSGPARRGRRRASDEDGEGNSPDDMMPLHQNEHGDLVAAGQDTEMADAPPSHQPARHSGSRSPYHDAYNRDYAATGSPVGSKASSLQRSGSLRGMSSRESRESHELPESHAQDEDEQPRRRSSDDPPPARSQAQAPPASSTRPSLPSSHDQENDLAYLARSVKPLIVPGLDLDKRYDDKGIRPLRAALQPAEKVQVPHAASLRTAAAGQPASPERKVLSTMSRNTPHRAPPPPPKMSVLETATAATAGSAATAQANKKPRILLKVNGRSYQRVDCIGRGGSGKVYKVTAENGKMFAMKRVSLENADESTIRGFLGEIDLLKKLSGVDRVIQLYDFEMNKEKHMLSVLMELGEMDYNSLLRVRQNPESAKLDPVFVRFYWKEMVECLQAVHAHDIVHSDLKPANFVLVQGRLKLIDFGIANAIQTEMTVNVHRETQIGTPNYMSPESLMDCQQYAFTAGHAGRPGAGSLMMGGVKGAPKLMKLGKPSDIWSLGCILYQMVYGLPPFGHIQNQMARCQAIITWTHAIDFPARGMGGVLVPPGLIATMKKCLNREQQLRPTCEDLLSPTDPFLYPEAQAMMLGGADSMPITEELLGRIIQSVVTRCRERMPTDGEAAGAWPAAYWASVRRTIQAREER